MVSTCTQAQSSHDATRGGKPCSSNITDGTRSCVTFKAQRLGSLSSPVVLAALRDPVRSATYGGQPDQRIGPNLVHQERATVSLDRARNGALPLMSVWYPRPSRCTRPNSVNQAIMSASKAWPRDLLLHGLTGKKLSAAALASDQSRRSLNGAFRGNLNLNTGQ